MLQSNNKINEYIDSVCGQIRWKKSHIYIAKELENHIIDQKNAFVSEGLGEDAAMEKAIIEMGDPIGVGSELDRVHKPKIEWSIIWITGIALILGLVIQFIVTKGTGSIIARSIAYSILGIAVMIIAYLTDYTTIGKNSKILFFGFLVIVLGISLFSPRYHGQVFYTKFVLLLYPTIYTGIIYSMRNNGYLGLVLCGVFMAISYIVLLPFVMYSTYALYSLLSLILITISIIKGWFNVDKIRGLLLIYVPIAIAVIMTLLNNTYLLSRLTNAFNPLLDPTGAGFMSNLARQILYNSNFFGEGAGSFSGTMLPGINTDFILTYLIHRFGWISLIVVIAVLALLIIRSFKLCLKQSSILGSLVSLSAVLTISAQIIIYVGYNLSFHLIAPLTLPLISYGGVGTIINMLLIGIMLSVFKWENLVNDNVLVSSDKRFLTFNDGKLIIDFKS
ncbi:FtsW/RodA/SpoVE family cell cycle protein [Tissierella sp. Yu-01]|uniref:FtsW/RodA/SpoVE family cell cycle protein n=1 Tax=Tissierella sp. Yu-01 TaxID=3035694 RepID=UPI00240E3B25|nr:FtsW/RodA/SpoVE family cell cycle protein [Tissierella sp. Yu-01]WFA09067.1 FtsW/RodA/SpoVE family cell cycle protein [Tissierella sp. Yu-01]